jgi:glucan phosphoethanolaminetransferase (alkaline phosphatase superfamily)
VPKKIDISNLYQFSDLSDDNIVGVLVIGESARYDHFGINGYERNTTPLISKIPNLFSFKASACANITYNSVPCMLTRFTGKEIDRVMEESGFLSILTKLGFNTDWIGTQSLLQYFKSIDSNTAYDEVNMAILPGGSALYKMNDYDEVMLPYLENILTKQGKKFIVLHTSGSHWNYAARYPENYKIFTPTCSSKSKIDQSSCTIEELINSYDNSILYTDYILDQIIKLLTDKNAFMIYVSDHGESLGEDGVFAHGSHMTLEQTTIPLIFWSSNSFIEHHPKLLNNLSKRMNQNLSHDNIFHSTLDCAGIEGEIIDKSMSLCR